MGRDICFTLKNGHFRSRDVRFSIVFRPLWHAVAETAGVIGFNNSGSAAKLLLGCLFDRITGCLSSLEPLHFWQYREGGSN